MQSMIIQSPPEVELANGAFARLEDLQIGESVLFDPALSDEVMQILHGLLYTVDKGWNMYYEQGPAMGFWKALAKFMHKPVDMETRRPILQSVGEIKRVR